MSESINLKKKKYDWKDFLLAMDDYAADRNNTGRRGIFYSGLSVYMKIPFSHFAGLFLLNKNTFEFDFKAGIPENSEKILEDLFESQIESGNIGFTLDSGNITDFTINSQHGTNMLAVPLKVNDGITGLVLVVHDNDSGNFDQILVRLSSLFGSMFASSIENASILNDLSNTKSLLEQKIAERTMDLSKSRTELQAILDTVLTGIIVVDDNTSLIEKINPLGMELLGDSEEKLINSNYSRFLPVEKENTDYFEKNGTYESVLTDIHGRKIPILRNSARLNLGNKVYLIESFIDITTRKQAEKALNDSKELLELKVQERTEELQLLVHKLKQENYEREKAEKELRKSFEKEKELSELKGRFVSMVSHEFRTPMTVIKSSAQMLTRFLDKLSPTDRNYYLEKIMKSVDNMAELIENVIFIGKTDANRIKIEDDYLKISQFCDEIVKDQEISTKNTRKIEVSIVGEERGIRLDKKILRLILTNLLTNAIKYSDKSTEIEFIIKFLDEGIIFDIKDYGIGIPEDEQDKIFDMFYRAKNVGDISGTGLGMSVVLESVRKLHGTIDFQSRVNEGTTFSIFIPYSG
jgi:two-component system sensor kinase FixL